MSQFLERFRSTVSGYLKENGVVVNTSDIGEDIIIEAQGKVVQLRLIDDGKMLISTIVYFNMMGEEYVDYRMVSEFNAYHLFRGGYRLMVEPSTLSIYVEENVSVQEYDAERLSTKLYDFVKRSISCTKWYIESLNAAADHMNNYRKTFV